MNHALQLAALGLIGTALTAQTVQITAHGTLSIDYQPLGGPVVNRSLPVAGTASLNLSSVGTSALTVGLTTTVHVTADSPPFGCYGCWSAARGDIVVEFSSPVPITAMLRLEQTPACQMSPVFLDIDNDGSWDIGTSSATSLDYPVVLGSQPLPVRIFAETVNFGGANCSYPARVTLLPQTGDLGAIGSPCGPSLGATLTGRNGRRMVLRVGGMNGMLGALGIGGAPASTVSCGPATTPIAAVILVPDPNGISLAVPLSPSLMGLLTLQYAELLPGGQLAFSNGVVAVLRCQAP